MPCLYIAVDQHLAIRKLLSFSCNTYLFYNMATIDTVKFSDVTASYIFCHHGLMYICSIDVMPARPFVSKT